MAENFTLDLPDAWWAMGYLTREPQTSLTIAKSINRDLAKFGVSIESRAVNRAMHNAVTRRPDFYSKTEDRPAKYSYICSDWEAIWESERICAVRLPPRTERALGVGNPLSYCAYLYHKEKREYRPWQWFACQLVMGLRKLRGEMGDDL